MVESLLQALAAAHVQYRNRKKEHRHHHEHDITHGFSLPGDFWPVISAAGSKSWALLYRRDDQEPIKKA
jgi:hypothetical protein